VLLLLLIASGCSLQPVYERPYAHIAGRYPSGAPYKTAHGDQGSTTQPAGDIGWGDFLRDARLQRLVEIALANNRDLRIVVLNVEQVRAQYRIQRAALYPQVGGAASAARSRTVIDRVQWTGHHIAELRGRRFRLMGDRFLRPCEEFERCRAPAIFCHRIREAGR
jgi:outer membrane protein TolC